MPASSGPYPASSYLGGAASPPATGLAACLAALALVAGTHEET